MNGTLDLEELRTNLSHFRNYDEARQQSFEALLERYERVAATVANLKSDLEDERDLRRRWKTRAELSEGSVTRGQFLLVLVDGDGYIFKEAFLRDPSNAGGARAAHELYTEVLSHAKDNKVLDGVNGEVQVLVNVYAHRSGLARHLCDAGVFQVPGQLDEFFCSFTQSRSLFQFIDCGFGKERADAKLRDTYRFYAYNAQCKQIYLACCHDNGYVAELDKYRHDAIAAPKTTLVHSASLARQYASLPFPTARFTNTFETSPLEATKKPTPAPAPAPVADDASSRTSVEATVSDAPPTWSTITASTTNVGARTGTPSLVSARPAAAPRGIPINRARQRVDLKLRPSTQQELAEFERRTRQHKLCNRYHLGGDCGAYNCRYDHEPINEGLKNVLKHKARTIPCANGSYCRLRNCHNGHHCPWGKTACDNAKCAFERAAMHDIDTEIVGTVEPED